MKVVTSKDWKKNHIPRMMWVWDFLKVNKKKMKVIYIEPINCVCTLFRVFSVITVNEFRRIECYKHCAEIE